MDCPHCGAANRPEARFCSTCGRSMLASSSSLTSKQVAPGPLRPGMRLQGGRYEVVRPLGKGAVLLAVDHRLDGKRVVIRELRPAASDPKQRQEAIRQLKREVARLAHLDHPLIPSVTDHFQEGERYFMVEEYIEGDSLNKLLEQRQGPLSEREVLIYAADIIDILEYLELQTPPVVHHDIKPANIVISASDGHAYLVGFSLAPAETEGERAQPEQMRNTAGTPGYAPPEQYQGNADPRSDLYALAATLHHALTGRDPRHYPPFNYPPVRSLNPQLSPETERILLYALQQDPNQRYQSASAMKRDIEALLFQRFGYRPGSYPAKADEPTLASGVVAGQTATSSGLLWSGWPNPSPTGPAALPASGSGGGFVSFPLPGGPATSLARRSIFSQRMLYGVLLLLLVVVVIAGGLLLFLIPRLISRGGPTTSLAQSRTITPPPTLKKGLGAYNVVNPDTGQKDYIGISDGSVAFDVARPDGDLKQQAAQRLRQGDISGAVALWQSALDVDSNDAEALIYLEDQRVLASGNPYITLIVATILTGNDSGAVGTGRDNLQGAYIAQKEYNSGYKLGSGVLVRLLIANSGSSSLFATTIAQQIVQAAKADKTIVGVMGWPYSSRVLSALPILSQAQLPMVSPSASSDQLSGKSAYFFRVCPSDQRQGAVGADYAYQHLRARRVALFLDPLDPYSQSLAAAFSQRYTAEGGTIVVEERYRVGKPANLPTLLEDALAHSPDLLYFSGYASDVATLLTNLPTTGPLARLQIMGGDALYQLQGYPSSARAGFLRLHFTAFAYPDEWSYLALSQPAFFTVYPQTFNANSRHVGYGYTRPDNDAILSYDATLVLLEASRHILGGNGKTTMSGAELRQALAGLNGPQAVQGISGVISLGPDGNPDNKAVVVLMVDNVGHIKIESVQGRFLK